MWQNRFKSYGERKRQNDGTPKKRKLKLYTDRQDFMDFSQ